MAERARNEKGQLMGDDPSTPNVNEAWEGGVAPSKEAKKKASTNSKTAKAQKAVKNSAPKVSAREANTIYVSAEPQVINRETGIEVTDTKLIGMKIGNTTCSQSTQSMSKRLRCTSSLYKEFISKRR